MQNSNRRRLAALCLTVGLPVYFTVLQAHYSTVRAVAPVRDHRGSDLITLRLWLESGDSLVVSAHDGGIIRVRRDEESYALILRKNDDQILPVEISVVRTNSGADCSTLLIRRLSLSSGTTRCQFGVASIREIELVGASTSFEKQNSNRSRNKNRNVNGSANKNSRDAKNANNATGDDRGGGGIGGGASGPGGLGGDQCCVTCQGISVCGCRVIGPCGDCCVESCCS